MASQKNISCEQLDMLAWIPCTNSRRALSQRTLRARSNCKSKAGLGKASQKNISYEQSLMLDVLAWIACTNSRRALPQRTLRARSNCKSRLRNGFTEEHFLRASLNVRRACVDRMHKFAESAFSKEQKNISCEQTLLLDVLTSPSSNLPLSDP